MRTWLSAPLGHGYRAGVSVNPNTITRELAWGQMLSPTGWRVLCALTAIKIVVLLYWMEQTRGHWDVEWLRFVIVSVASHYLVKWTLLSIFPRNFDEVGVADTEDRSAEIPRNAWGEPIESDGKSSMDPTGRDAMARLR